MTLFLYQTVFTNSFKWNFAFPSLFFILRLHVEISATSFNASIGFYIEWRVYPHIELVRNPLRSVENYSIL